MKKITKQLLALSMGFSLLLTGCGEADGILGGALGTDGTPTVDGQLGGGETTGSGTATGGSGTGTGTATGSGSTGNNRFAEFIKPGDTYFGPLGDSASVTSGLTGNDSAGSRFGGPDNSVGVLIVVRNARGYMEVVNLSNKSRYPVVHSTDGSNFSVPADTLGGRPFPSLFVIKIDSLSAFSFDHRVSPSPVQCNRYEARFDNTKYIATKQGETGACRAAL